MVLNSAPGGSTDLVSGVCVCGVHACVRACVRVCMRYLWHWLIVVGNNDITYDR